MKTIVSITLAGLVATSIASCARIPIEDNPCASPGWECDSHVAEQLVRNHNPSSYEAVYPVHESSEVIPLNAGDYPWGDPNKTCWISERSRLYQIGVLEDGRAIVQNGGPESTSSRRKNDTNCRGGEILAVAFSQN